MHYFHETLRKLPESEVKLIAIPTGKRDTNDQPVYLYVENNCAHAWHAAARRQSFANVGERMIPQITLSQFNGVQQPPSPPANNNGDNGNENVNANLPQAN